MKIARSKVTAQGQVSVPAAIRQKFGIGPGSVLEWEQDGEQILIRRIGGFSSEDVRRALFPKAPPSPRTIEELKDGVRLRMKKRYARH